MIDLHCHSTCSDGTCTPEELAEKGRGFSVFALTDHDTCDGCARFLAASQAARDVRFAGVELSIEPGEGFGKFHLLGLGVDPENPRLRTFLAKIRAGRDERNVKILERLAALGMPVSEEDVLRHAGGEVVARPHIARALMDHGWAASVADAFNRIIGTGCPGYAPRYRPSQAEAIEVVHAAGGVAVMAHPRFWTQDLVRLRAGLVDLMDLGLDGLEAMYRANEPGETVEHLRIARSLGLAVTAGSDFHGANKPDIPLGMSPDDDADYLVPFFARLEQMRQMKGRA